jgi:NADP-reducing hydrogenase subunit HndD
VIELTVDGQRLEVEEGTTILGACTEAAIDTPTICWAPNLTPVNVCRVCVVEVEGSRALVPACSRPAEDGMVVHTDSERVRHSRKIVLEFLGSGVDLSQADGLGRWVEHYGADPDRYGRDEHPAERVQEPVKIQDGLYIRDYEKCVLCYKCVEACGDDAQHTFAIAVSGRGFDARIATEYDVELPDSACVYCGNCIGACSSRPSTTCGKPRTGVPRARPSPPPSVPTAAWAATWSCMSKTSASSRSPVPWTTRSPRATSASRAASAGSTSRAPHRGPERAPTVAIGRQAAHWTPMDRRRGSLLVVVVIALTVVACGGSGYEYVENDDAGLYFRVPDTWSVVPVDTTDEAVPETLLQSEQWVRLLDRSSEPDLANLQAQAPTAPVGLASVSSVATNAERDELDYAALRSMALSGEDDPLALASTSDSGVALVSLEDVTTDDGVRGERIVFTVTQDGGGLVTFDHTALVNPLTTEIYRLFLKCEAHCYEANRGEIDDIVDSWTIEQED